MKNTFKVLIALLMIGGIWSCEDDDNFMFAEPQAGEFAILTPSSGSSVVITETTDQNNVGATFTWEAVDYGVPTEVTYTLEFALNGTDFADPITIASGSATNYSMTFADLQAKASQLDPDPLDEGAVPIDVRVKSTIGTAGGEEKISTAITIGVTPYIIANPPKRDLFLVGPASEAGWSNNNGNMPMFRDSANDDLYHLTAYLNAGELKFLEKRGQWAPQYGTDGTNLVPRPTEAQPDPSPIMIASAGYYEITVDVANLTYSITPYDASSATTFSTVGIIGTATPDDWNSDTDLFNSTLNPHIWHATIDLTAEAVKFRANNDWAVPGNWGAGSATLGGQMNIDGGDFFPLVEAGTYEVWFNDIDRRYLFIPVE